MLILSRMIGETIVIGDDAIRITVVDVHGDKVRLGITAPRHVSVHREEVHDRIQQRKGEDDAAGPQAASDGER